MSRNYMSKNDELRKGDYLLSNNREWKAVFQEDGNFVIYGWKPVWTSGTKGTDGMRLCMQADSNLVMYNAIGQAIWSTGTHTAGSNMVHLQLTNTGDLVVFRESGEIWKSTNDFDAAAHLLLM